MYSKAGWASTDYTCLEDHSVNSELNNKIWTSRYNLSGGYSFLIIWWDLESSWKRSLGLSMRSLAEGSPEQGRPWLKAHTLDRAQKGRQACPDRSGSLPPQCRYNMAKFFAFLPSRLLLHHDEFCTQTVKHNKLFLNLH